MGSGISVKLHEGISSLSHEFKELSNEFTHRSHDDLGECVCNDGNKRRRSSILRLQLLSKGNLSDHYTVDNNILGSGSFAIVKKGTKIDTQQEVAIKYISKKLVQVDPITLNSEVQALKMCGSHPHILALYDVFETENDVILVMQLAPGGELFKSVKRLGNFSEQDVSILIKDITEALQYMHEKGVVHRDLKPENLLLAEPGPNGAINVQVADFGLAKILVAPKALKILSSSTKDHNNWMRTACGSRLYAAPEVIQHQMYDASVDMWGLGVVMYVLLSGDVPFVKLNDIIEAKLEFKGSIWNFVSDDAKDLIKGLVQKDPNARLTPENVLQHKWVKDAAPTSPLPDLSVLLHSFEKTHGLQKLALQVMTKLLKPAEVEEMRSLFERYDTDKTGEITVQNLHDLIKTGELHCTEQELHRALLQGELGPAQAALNGEVEARSSACVGKSKSEDDMAIRRWRCTSEIDAFDRPQMKQDRRKSTEMLEDNDPMNYLQAVVTFEDFQMFMIAVQKDALQQHLHETWQRLDVNGDGYLSASELQVSIRKMLGSSVSKNDMNRLIHATAGENASSVSYEDFLHEMGKSLSRGGEPTQKAAAEE